MKKYKQIIISLNNKREILLRYILVAIATVILLKFNELDIYYERHEKYFLFLVPIMTTIAIFVMNFNSGKVLNKPFSFYYVKYWGSIMWIIIPIVFQFILFTIGVDINFNKYILVFNSLFYSYLVFEVFKDIFKWNHSYYFRKYRNGYVEAIKMLPFTEVDDARMFFEFSEIMDNDTIQLKEEYPNICNERLNTLIQIRKTNNEIDMDDFTFKLLQLNVIENSSISIDLKHEYDFYNSFFKRSDKNFLREILLKCDFKLDNYTSEITFRIVFDHFCERIDNYTGFKLFLKNVINIREDLDSSFIKSTGYIGLYNNKSDNAVDILEEAYKDAYVEDIYDLLSLEALHLSHSQMIENFPDIDNRFTNTFNRFELSYYECSDSLEVYPNNLSEFDKKFEDFEEFFYSVVKGFKMNFQGMYSTKILYSKRKSSSGVC